MKTLNIMTIIVISLLFVNSSWGQSYHQIAAEPSTADFFAFDNSQGVATQIEIELYPQSVINGGGQHYHWVGVWIKEPQQDVFTQMGWVSLSNFNSTAVPFIFTSGSSVPNSNIFMIYRNHSLNNAQYVTFWYDTNGVVNPDGTYNWNFHYHYPGSSGPNIQTLKFKSKNSRAPFVISEVAGSSNACNDVFSVTYGQTRGSIYSLLAKKNGTWSHIKHTNANYHFSQCNNNTDATTVSTSQKRHTAQMPKSRTNCHGCQIW